MSSHKKHLLQLTMIIAFNYSFGSPKLQSQCAILSLLCSLVLCLFSEFNVYGFVFGVAVHLSRFREDMYMQSTWTICSFILVMIMNYDLTQKSISFLTFVAK